MDRITNAAVLIAALVVISIAYQQYASQPAVLKPGDVVTVPTITNAPTLVAFVRPGCHFCEESLPFYNRLFDGGKKILLASPDVQGELATGATIKATVVRADIDALNVTGTPTLALIKDGRVVKVWRGKLRPDQEVEVEHSL